MENFNQRFGRLMAIKMEQKKITQYELSAFCEVAQPSISAYVYGKTSPRLDVALKICQFLDIKLNEIK